MGFNYIPPSGENTYIVKKGDTLYSISNMFGLTVNELKSLNNLTNNTISVGQVLKISKQSIPSTEEYDKYTVQKGDTLYSIANRYNISVYKLKSINNLTNNTLTIGQVLNVPKSGTTNPTTYTVQSGDTIFMGNKEY